MSSLELGSVFTQIHVYSAITDLLSAIGKVDFRLQTDHGSQNTSMTFTASEMRRLAEYLNYHAARLDQLATEAEFLREEAA